MAQKKKSSSNAKQKLSTPIAQAAGEVNGESSFQLPALLGKDPRVIRQMAARLSLFFVGLAVSLALPLIFMATYSFLVGDLGHHDMRNNGSPSMNTTLLFKPPGHVQTDDKAFVRWFNSVGGENRKVSIAHFRGEGRGVIATEPVHEKDVVLSVPMDWVICRKTIMRLSSPQEKQLYDSLQEDEDVLSLFLMKQLALGTQSPWWPYLKVLPSTVPVPVLFQPWELLAIQNENEVELAKKERRRLEQRYESLRELITKAFADLRSEEDLNEARKLHEDKLDGADFTSAELFLWTRSILGSRALTMQGARYLVPFADMFNYRPDTRSRKFMNGQHFLDYHKIVKNEFQVLADRSVAMAGAQLYEDYGDNDNYIYFRHHGFIAETNPFDCVELDLPRLSEEDPGLEAKKSLFQRLNVMSPPRLCVNVNAVNATITSSQKLEAETLVPAVIPGTALFYLKIYFMDAETASKCSGSPSPQNCERPALQEEEIIRWIAATSERMLRSSMTDVAEDEALLSRLSNASGDSSSEKMKLAVQFRRSRKLILSRLLALLRPNSEDLVKDLTGYGVDRAGSSDLQKGLSGSVAPTDSHGDADTPSERGKEAESSAELQAAADRFNTWMLDQRYPTNKLLVSVFDGMRLGTRALEPIKQGEVYLSVPVSVVMDASSALACDKLGPVFKELVKKYGRRDPQQELLLHFIYEKFVRAGDSFWAPYLDILPSLEELETPVLYSPEERKWLEGSSVLVALHNYDEQIRRRYELVHQLILSQYPDVFDATAFSLQNYLYANIILDSRSIWWDGARHLVPVLDMINCMEGPDPSVVHRTTLDSSGRNAETRAPWDFAKGEQVFENYGQPNYIYFLYHGFVLDENTHDCLQLPLAMTRAEASYHKHEFLVSKLRDLGIYSLEHTFCLPSNNVPENVLEFLWLKHAAELGTATRKARRKFAEAKLLDILTAKLEGYSLSPDTISRQLSEESPSFRRKMSLKLIRQEQVMIQGHVQALKDRAERESEKADL